MNTNNYNNKLDLDAVENIQEESLEDDEFEAVMNQKIAEHNSKDNKPKWSLPQNNYQTTNNDYPVETNDIFQEIYKKISNYAVMNSLRLDQFWKSTNIFVDPDQFIQFFTNINLKISESDLELIIGDLITYDGQIQLQSFSRKIKAWEKDYNNMLDLVKDKALRIAQESQRRIQSAQSIIKKRSFSGRPKSSNDMLKSSSQSGIHRPISGKLRPISGISTISIRSKYSGFNQTQELKDQEYQEQAIKTFDITKFFKQTRQREFAINKSINSTIQHSQMEQIYECYVKMGEANEILKQLKNPINFRLMKTSNDDILCLMYESDSRIRDMTITEFFREYYLIISQFKKIKAHQISQLQVESDIKPNHLKNSLINANSNTQNNQNNQSQSKIKEEDKEYEYQTGKVPDKKDRQDKLKEALFETMYLVKTLKDQINALQNRGINQHIKINTGVFNPSGSQVQSQFMSSTKY